MHSAAAKMYPAYAPGMLDPIRLFTMHAGAKRTSSSSCYAWRRRRSAALMMRCWRHAPAMPSWMRRASGSAWTASWVNLPMSLFKVQNMSWCAPEVLQCMHPCHGKLRKLLQGLSRHPCHVQVRSWRLRQIWQHQHTNMCHGFWWMASPWVSHLRAASLVLST